MAIAVSGGADSLALVLMAKEELAVYGYEIVALTVDHGLRPSSAQEAEYVANLMQANAIEHHILVWHGVKPQTGVEEAARAARYGLLTEWCKNNGVKILLTAHHQNDQAETFLMRLQRGSGLEGLCSIREISCNNGITVARPLLNTSPEQLRKYLTKRGIEWVEDESNADTHYLRNRVRSFLPQMQVDIGIGAQNLAATAARLQSAEDYIEQQVRQVMCAQVHSYEGIVHCIKYTDFLRWHQEIKFRIVAQLCRRSYIPRAERIVSAIIAMSGVPFKGITLGEKEIFEAYGNIWIVPELTAKRKTSRKEWKKWVANHTDYANLEIPHKARVAILEQVEKTYDL